MIQNIYGLRNSPQERRIKQKRVDKIKAAFKDLQKGLSGSDRDFIQGKMFHQRSFQVIWQSFSTSPRQQNVNEIKLSKQPKLFLLELLKYKVNFSSLFRNRLQKLTTTGNLFKNVSLRAGKRLVCLDIKPCLSQLAFFVAPVGEVWNRGRKEGFSYYRLPITTWAKTTPIKLVMLRSCLRRPGSCRFDLFSKICH